MADAQVFHKQFTAIASCNATGLRIPRMPEWGEKLIRRSGGVPQAILRKLGSNSFSKRRPPDDAPFLSYIQRRYDEQAFLQLRIVVGPVKNGQQYGAYQEPDLAEYLMLIQLARLMEAIAALYPHGVKIQMIPDDIRGQTANGWPHAYSLRYITGLQRMAEHLQFQSWLDVEEGQARLYDWYGVEKYLWKAEEKVMSDPDYDANLARACIHAEENCVALREEKDMASAVRDSALRYLMCYEAEMMSGMWSPGEALPLMYAQHPGNYQLYTMGQGLTKLPWQIRLPFDSCVAGNVFGQLPRPRLVDNVDKVEA